MPLTDFTFPKGALDQDARARAVDLLTGAILRGEGPPDNPQTRSISWMHVHELPIDCICVGGSPADRPRYRVEITLPEGTGLSGPGPDAANGRKALVREAAEIVLNAEGTPFSPEEALRVWVLIREIRDGCWGAMGTTLRMEEISAFAHEIDGDSDPHPDAPKVASA